MSNLRDDWLAVNVNISEEGDPILSCVFKTEFVTQLVKLTNSNINVVIGPMVDYAKKKEKRAQIKFIKDETVRRDDVYKSHTVHVPSGEPPNSVSRPPAKRKPGVVRPITQGKLLRAGGPSKPQSRARPVAQPLPGASSRPTPTPAASKPTPAPVAAPVKVTSTNNAQRAAPAPPRNVAPPPPPPPPPRQPEVPQYRVKFAFDGQEGEMSLKKDEIVELVEKDDNGWWLVKKDGVEGWAPNNYLELVQQNQPPPPPPPPPRKVAPAPSAGPKITPSSVTANANAKPVSVFPGLAAGNGSAQPWKKPSAVAASSSYSSDASPSNSRPSSSLASKPPAPPVAGNKPKPTPPPIGGKPGPGAAPKIGGGKPPIPMAARPTPAPPKPGGGSVTKPAAAIGQMDLAAALAKRAQMSNNG